MKNKKLPPKHPGEILFEEFLKPIESVAGKGCKRYQRAGEISLVRSQRADGQS